MINNTNFKTFIPFVTLALLMYMPVAWAGAPAQINYQGKLADTAGNPITNAGQTIQVEIFDQVTYGTCVFGPETHTVNVSNGLFSLQIGSIVNGLDTAVSSGADLYLEITIDPGLPTQAVLTPRQRLVAAPYALSVAADSVGGSEIIDASVGTGDLADNAVTSVKIVNNTITNDDINAGAAIAASKLAGVLTTGATRTNANLDILTAGAASDADALHTHSGLTAADHAGTHAPGGTDALGSVYISTYTAQIINGLKTFNPDAPGAPFALGPNAAGQLVTGLNADLLNGRNVFDMVVSTRVVSAGAGLTGGGNLTADRALSLDLSSVNTWTGAQTFGAVTNFPDNGIWNAAGSVGIGTNNPGTYKLNVNGQMNATELCINGSCQSNWPSTGLWTPGAGNEIYYDLAYVGIGTTDPAYDLDVNGAINAQTNLCIGTDCIDSWNAVPPWTVGTGPDRIYYTAGNVGIGPGVVTPSEALEVAGNIAVSGTVDGYDLSAAGPVWDNDLVNDDVDASELTSLFTGTAGLMRKIDASNYGTLGSLPGSMIDNDAITSAHLAADSVASDEIAANAVGSSELACSNDNELLRGGTAGCIPYDNWDTAYGWGNHAGAGYLTSYTETDPTVASSVKDGVSWSEVTDKPAGLDGHSLDAADGSTADVVYVDNAGNVGIGTMSPGSQLDVNPGSIRSHSAQSTMADPEYIEIGHTGSSAFINTARDGTLSFRYEDDPKMTLTLNGRLGIGTTNPQSMLHVDGNAWVANSLRVVKDGDINKYVDMTVTDTETDIQSRGSALALNRNAGSDDENVVMCVEKGNVGIGNGAPISKLHVFNGDAYVQNNTGSSTYEYGLRTWVSSTGERAYGIYSLVNAPTDNRNYGIYSSCTSGDIANYGILGSASGSSQTNYGIYGVASGGTTNYAGYFDGDVHVTGTLSKGGGSFLIDHPLDPKNKVLRHSFVESPDMKNIYDGVVVLDGQGEAAVKLPDYFEALNKDFRYQLTSIGGSQPGLYIKEEVRRNGFVIAGGNPGGKVSWQVTGSRKDPYAAAHPIVVEEEKSGDKKGKCMHEEACR